MPPSESIDPLSPTLREWRVAPHPNPNFRTNVWARIDAARRPSTWTKFARAHPAFVAAFVAAGVLFGAWSGQAKARERTDADRTTLAANYVHRLDARWMREP